MAYDEEAVKKRVQEEVLAFEQLRLLTLEKGLLDEDGYPSEAALNLIAKWHWSRPKELFEFMYGIWHLKSWGWHEETEDNKTVYNISTAGWSGNESIIYALEQNSFMWSLHWVQSRKGGHYIFEVENGVGLHF